MSVGGAGWPGRLEPAGADSGLEEAAESAAARSAAENAPPAAASTSGARHAVLAGLGAGPRDEALVLEGYELAVAADGRLLPAGPTPPEGGPLGLLNALALRPAGAPGPFDGLGAEHAGLLDRLSARLAQTHKALAGEAPDEATHLAWRQGRAAALHLMEEAAARAFALGDGALGRRILRRLTAAVQAEPWRQVRDFAFERLVARAEASELPEVRAAREALYPSRPPYEKWLADGKIDILMYVDDSGSLIADNIEFYKELGFRHTANADGSHTLRLDRSGEEPPVVITIPPKQGTPALFEKMDDPAVDVIAYAGHAGYGHRVDHALARGVGGSGEGKLVLLMQCWGEGNVESLERAYPDAQVLSTTAMTDDNLDFTLMENLIDGFRKQQSWKQIERRTERDLKRWFGDDPDYRYTDLESQYFFPTTRSTLVKHYDRDGDGVKDGQDHIFHVIYPKRVDASGGYDPVVQPIPRHALDGTALGRSVSELSLAIRYNHLLPPELERRLPWDPERWRPGGFFEPAGGDLRAFRFERGEDGGVRVTLSSRFAHTQAEDLSRMLAYEAGLWLGEQAGLEPAERVALGIGLLERIVHQQGTWYSARDTLDEPWAEEALFVRRYGLQGLPSFGELQRLVGDPEDYLPEHFERLKERVLRVPGLAEAAERMPARVGEPLAVPPGLRLANRSWLALEDLANVLARLGIEGEIQSFGPRGLEQNQPGNVALVVRQGERSFVLGLGIDSTGVVTAAARHELHMDHKIEEAVVRILDGLAAAGGLEPAAGRAAYEEARAAGRDIRGALDLALPGLAARLPAGVRPQLGELLSLHNHGLIDPVLLGAVEAAFRRHFPRQ